MDYESDDDLVPWGVDPFPIITQATRRIIEEQGIVNEANIARAVTEQQRIINEAHVNAQIARKLAEQLRIADEARDKVSRAALHAIQKAKKVAKDARRDEHRRIKREGGASPGGHDSSYIGP